MQITEEDQMVIKGDHEVTVQVRIWRKRWFDDFIKAVEERLGHAGGDVSLIGVQSTVDLLDLDVAWLQEYTALIEDRLQQRRIVTDTLGVDHQGLQVLVAVSLDAVVSHRTLFVRPTQVRTEHEFDFSLAFGVEGFRIAEGQLVGNQLGSVERVDHLNQQLLAGLIETIQRGSAVTHQSDL
ncbi:hypothetical protein D3C86_1372590 [compost metagenome]